MGTGVATLAPVCSRGSRGAEVGSGSCGHCGTGWQQSQQRCRNGFRCRALQWAQQQGLWHWFVGEAAEVQKWVPGVLLCNGNRCGHCGTSSQQRQQRCRSGFWVWCFAVGTGVATVALVCSRGAEVGSRGGVLHWVQQCHRKVGVEAVHCCGLSWVLFLFWDA